MKRTISMFYLNGNNELEPEVWNSFKDIINNAYKFNETIIVQIALQQREITNFIRRRENEIGESGWVGCRRYIIENGNIKCEKIGNINMADPKEVYNFVKWAQDNYYGESYHLTIGGHVYQFIGISPDYSFNRPYLLGFVELSFALQEVYKQTNKSIDLLILDTCYASSFETISEFGRYRLPAVKNIITYIGDGPIGGMPYSEMLKILNSACYRNLSSSETIFFIINELSKQFKFPLIGIKIDHFKLIQIKNKFSDIACKYMTYTNGDLSKENFYEILNINSLYTWNKEVIELNNIAKDMIITYSRENIYMRVGLPIHVLYKRLHDSERKALYKKLYFASGNKWTNLVCGYPINKNIKEYNPTMEPMIMTDMILTAFIINSNKNSLSNDQCIKLKNELIVMKEWNGYQGSEGIKKKKLKIAYVIPHLNLTGGMKMLIQQMEKLRLRGHKIIAIYKCQNNIKELDFKWIKFDADEKIIIDNKDKYLDYIEDCDVIVAGWIMQLPELSVSSKPLIYWEQGHEFLFGDFSAARESEYRIMKTMKYCYTRKCSIYSVSKFVSNNLFDKYGIKSSVLSNGVDLNYYNNLNQKYSNVILLVGNPNLKFKGFDIALSALKLVKEFGIDFKIKWACQIKPKYSNFDLEIEYIECPNQEHLLELYSKSTILLFSSWYEGFGMPPLEAMASGTAVVTTECFGVSDYIINGYNALTVKTGDIKAMAASVILLLKDEKLRKMLIVNGLNTAKEFSYDRVIRELESILYSKVDTLI